MRRDPRDEMRRKAATVSRVFSSPEGQEALKILIDQFGGSCYAKGDPYHTSYLEGARDVLVYIKELMEHNAKEIGDVP